MNHYFAHSTDNSTGSDWQELKEHLLAVGELAKINADVFGCGELAYAQGVLHDLGKYTTEFQRRLRGDAIRVDHSTHGAKLAVSKFGAVGQLLAYGIAGHHAGLANGQGVGERSSLAERMKQPLPDLSDQWKRDVVLPAALKLPTDFKLFRQDKKLAKARYPFQLAFLTRMLFSCLVDADFIDTERFYKRIYGIADYRRAGSNTADLLPLREQLDRYLNGFAVNSEVNRLRAEILKGVRQRASELPGLFSLTVPTGGGKTLASLAFALDHAIAHGLRRVIFVIPYETQDLQPIYNLKASRPSWARGLKQFRSGQACALMHSS